MQMLEKNIDQFANVLEDMGMVETASAFKTEFLSKPNDEYQLGKYNILKHLQTQLNKYSGLNVSNKYCPTIKKRSREKNETFNLFLKKLANKDNESSTKMSIDSNSKVYKHMCERIEKEYRNSMIKKDNKSSVIFSDKDKQMDYYANDEGYESNQDDNKDELPCFGTSKKKNVNEMNNSFGDDSFKNNEHNEDKKEEIPKQKKISDINEILSRSFGAFEPKNTKLNELSKDDKINDKDIFEGNGQSPFDQGDLNNNDSIDEYVDDEDPGFDLYECDKEYFRDTCEKLSEKNGFPRRGVYKSKFSSYTQMNIDFPNGVKCQNDKIKLVTVDPKDKSAFKIDNNPNQNMVWSKSKLSQNLSFPQQKDKDNSYYPVLYNEDFIDSYDLKFVVDLERTGFEESKDFKIIINNLVAGRYQILGYLGNAAFSKAVKALDVCTNQLVCLKIVENNKDYFDQSLDEIKVLKYINANGDPEEKHFLKLYDYFYFKEHLFIVTELLKDNLFDFYEYLTKKNIENYFTLQRLQMITKQILIALDYIHSLHLIHCDLKPENILIKSIKEVTVKIIDFGSSSFIHDSLSSYIQSRSYRAPEVIMGCKYDYKIDIWSLGCILAELYSGYVLFQSDSLQSLLARVIGIIGPIPDWMYQKGKTVKELFTKEKLLYTEANGEGSGERNARNIKNKKMHIYVPKKSSLKKRLKCKDENFVNFVRTLLQIDPNLRPTAKEALKHPWLTTVKYDK